MTRPQNPRTVLRQMDRVTLDRIHQATRTLVDTGIDDDYAFMINQMVSVIIMDDDYAVAMATS